MKARIVQVLVLISASAAAQAQFKADPEAFLEAAGLAQEERQVVLSGDTDAIRAALGDTATLAQMINSPF
jgi:hypothetical protein